MDDHYPRYKLQAPTGLNAIWAEPERALFRSAFSYIETTCHARPDRKISSWCKVEIIYLHYKIIEFHWSAQFVTYLSEV